MATTPNPMSPAAAAPLASTATLALTGSADVNDATKKAGLSFGKLLETTGLAIAESQRQLNEVGAASTSALAGQMVDVIAAQVNAYDDDGNLDANGTETLPMKLPLINFIDPVFYEWAQVRLQGRFFATEFVGSTETSSSGVSASVSTSSTGGFLFGFGSSTVGFGVRGNSSDVDTSVEQSFGNIRASALLTPKTDIGVPKPRQLVDAPSLGVQVGPDVDDVAEPGSRLKKASILCFKRDGSKQDAGKSLPLSIEVDGALWSFDAANAADQGKTDADGRVPIRLKRVLPVPAGQDAPDRSPVDVTVTVRLGVVSTTTVIRF
jgi:hypothetical protein